MKDFDPTPKADNRELAAEHRQVRQEQEITRAKLRPGHTMWEFDMAAGTLEPAKIENVTAVINHHQPKMGFGRESIGIPKATTTIVRKIIQRDGCLYAAALNRKNALPKIMKMYAQLVADGVIEPKKK